MEVDSPVYLGLWTNWSRGSAVTGATLTTTRSNGNLLIAFTALFVPFVTSRIWRIFAIKLHQYYSNSEAQHTVHQQRQVVLRNSYSPESGLLSFVRLVWAWRRTSRQAWSRLVPLTLFALCFSGVMIVAGGFSSRIETSSEVLLKGDNCSAPSTENFGNITLANINVGYWASFANNMQNYAQQCYSSFNSSTLLPECSRYPASALPTECAPLDTENRTQNLTFSNRNFTTYNYGSPRLDNHTYMVPDLATQYGKWPSGEVQNADNFLLSTRGYEKTPSSISPWIPRPASPEYQGDMTLYFLSGNGVWFMSPTEDDWYRATVPDSTFTRGNLTGVRQRYRPDEAASPLGCVEQYQWCRDPAQGQCGELAGEVDALYSAGPLFGLTDKDLDLDRPTSRSKSGSLLIWTYLMLGSRSLGVFIDSLSSSSLASVISLSQGNILQIEKNQWQLDVTKWWHIMLAGFQAKVVNTAQGSANAPFQPSTYKPENELEWNLCRNQKIRSTQYANFSVLGLVITYTIGALIIMISFGVEPVLNMLQKRGWYSKYAYLRVAGRDGDPAAPCSPGPARPRGMEPLRRQDTHHAAGRPAGPLRHHGPQASGARPHPREGLGRGRPRRKA
ncbi:bacterial alpha-L-rhamnosidase-domain-containing protein [Apiospora arundinis]